MAFAAPRMSVSHTSTPLNGNWKKSQNRNNIKAPVVLLDKLNNSKPLLSPKNNLPLSSFGYYEHQTDTSVSSNKAITTQCDLQKALNMAIQTNQVTRNNSNFQGITHCERRHNEKNHNHTVNIGYTPDQSKLLEQSQSKGKRKLFNAVRNFEEIGSPKAGQIRDAARYTTCRS